ncbi:MAG: Modification methylase PvuII [Phycisphaerae bacterium]|nr:Modification methylase PvuII [Phycisphaerae bacterium]
MLPTPAYKTNLGAAYIGDSLSLLPALPVESVDLVFTSPPFALQRQKTYGNKDQSEYVDWLLSFLPKILPAMKETGSFVIDMGGAYKKGKPVRSLYQYRFLLRACDEFGFRLAEEFYWFNPAKLPSPIEWVNKRKLRAKDAVNTVWWLSKSDNPKADVSRVLSPYSERMKTLLRNAESFYLPKKRPSGHDISKGFGRAGEGAIPSNLLQIPNTESNSPYLRLCKQTGATGHPARFPQRLPEFFIKFLTTEGDTVLDFFAGSNTTGAAAQALKRRWIAFELEAEYVATSAFRFVDPTNVESARQTYDAIRSGKSSLVLNGFVPPAKTQAKVKPVASLKNTETSLFAH